jgi:hypothetical protein
MLKISYANYRSEEDKLLDYEIRRSSIYAELRDTLPWDMTPENKLNLSNEGIELDKAIKELRAVLGVAMHTRLYIGVGIY